jgi:hypothetical protein
MIRSKSLEEKIRQMHPLIVMGMHRSGTSLTARLLKDLGIHMGSYLSRDAEAVHFQKINRRIYDSVGSNWSEIDSLIKAMGSEGFIREQANQAGETLFPEARFFTRNPGISDYFGPKLWNSICQGETVYWGWKDPRTTITFPIWLQVFPRARFLHVLRNGIDVAISTHRRSHKQRQKIWKRVIRLDYRPITLDFEYCYQLWEKYVSFVLKHKMIIPPDHFLEVCYEDLLTNPEKTLREIFDFIEYPTQDDLLNAACEQIDQGRLDNRDYAKPYQDRIPSLASRPLMNHLGYFYTTAGEKRGKA